MNEAAVQQVPSHDFSFFNMKKTFITASSPKPKCKKRDSFIQV